MRVDTMRQTPHPERLVCQYARGDYWGGYVPETEFDDLMASVDYDESHVDAVHDIFEHHSVTASNRPRDEYGMDEEYLVYDTDESFRHVASDQRDAFPDPETLYRMYALIEELIGKGHGHWGVFEHPQLNLYAKGASRALMAQVTRHRHITFDVQSQRYVDFSQKDDPVKTPATIREDVDTTLRLNREQGLTELDPEVREELREMGDDLVEQSLDLYETMIDRGMPTEDARFYLPIGTTVNIGFSGNARALLHVMNVRMQADAQWEARELSGMMLDEFREWMPMTHHIFEDNGPFKLAP